MPQLRLYKLVFKAKQHEYGDVFTFIFDLPKPIRFQAGQYAHLMLSRIPGGNRWRELSFASAPDEDEMWFSVHVRDESPFKQKLSKLQQGDLAWVFGVEGNFTVPSQTNKPLVMLVGGIGITPVRSMVRSIERQHKEADITVVHVSHDDYLYKEEFLKLSHAQYRVKRGELDEILIKIGKEKPTALYYVAGSEGFVTDMKNKLKNSGVRKDDIKIDTFKGYKSKN